MYSHRICSSIIQGTLRSHFNEFFGSIRNQVHSESFTRKLFSLTFSDSGSYLHQHRWLKNSSTLSICERKSSRIQISKQFLNSCFVSSVGSTNGLQNDDKTKRIEAEQLQDEPNQNLDARRSKITLDTDGYMLIDDLVKFLLREGAMDLCVISTSGKRKAYVDYFVVVSGASARHLRAMAKNLEYQFRGHEVRGVGKSGHVTVEGLESEHWMVLDIGNAVVHFFLPEVRELYELEKLWTLGPHYDDQYRALLEGDEQLDAAFLGRRTNEKDEIDFE